MFPHKWGRQESREIKESVSEKRGKSREDYLDHLPRRQRRLPDEPSGEREKSCNLQITSKIISILLGFIVHEDDMGIGNLEKMKNKLLDCSEDTIRRCKHLWFANL